MNMASDHLDLLPQRFEQHPLAHAEPLKQSELGPYRFRIGNDCVDFELNGQEIVVLRVGTGEKSTNADSAGLHSFQNIISQ